MTKPLIYYYKEEKTNIPILTGSSSDYECILYNEEINKITEMFPKAKKFIRID